MVYYIRAKGTVVVPISEVTKGPQMKSLVVSIVAAFAFAGPAFAQDSQDSCPKGYGCSATESAGPSLASYGFGGQPPTALTIAPLRDYPYSGPDPRGYGTCPFARGYAADGDTCQQAAAHQGYRLTFGRPVGVPVPAPVYGGGGYPPIQRGTSDLAKVLMGAALIIDGIEGMDDSRRPPSATYRPQPVGPAIPVGQICRDGRTGRTFPC